MQDFGIYLLNGSRLDIFMERIIDWKEIMKQLSADNAYENY